MPTPQRATFSVQAKVASNTAMLALLDGAGTAKLKLRNSLDQLVAQALFAAPAGAINAQGQLVLSLAANPVPTMSSNVAYVELCDGADVAHISMPAKTGSDAEVGWLVLADLMTAVGVAVKIDELRIG